MHGGLTLAEARVFLGVVAFLILGWVLNLAVLVKLFFTHAPADTLFFGRILGVPVFPLGAILGWVGLFF
jgi:hypothetical protein